MSKKELPVSERIKILLEKRAGGNKSELGRAAGISGQGIADLIGGQKGGPSFTVVQNILRSYPDLSERWLIFGEGEMLKTPPQNAEAQKDLSYMHPALTVYDEGDEPVTPPGAGSTGISKQLRVGETVHHQGRPQLTYAMPLPTVVGGMRMEPAGTAAQPEPEMPGLDLLRKVAEHSREIAELRQEIAQLTSRAKQEQTDTPS